MIKIEKITWMGPRQMEMVIEGMRNPMNSWNRTDSQFDDKGIVVGKQDGRLMRQLVKGGPEHRKFLRMMPVYFRITAPLYIWKEIDTYKVGTVSNSCSTMHKITAEKFTLENFSHDKLDETSLAHLKSTIDLLNQYRNIYINADSIFKEGVEEKKKQIWWQIIQLLPSSYNQTRNLMVNYEVLLNMYMQRKNHKLDEWREFCITIKQMPILSEIIDDLEQEI